MTARPQMARLAGAAAAVVLFAGLVTLATHGAAGKAQPALRPPSNAIPQSNATPVTAPPGDPDITGQVQPPAPGLYRYQTTWADATIPPSEYAVQISLVGPTTDDVTIDDLLSTNGIQTTDVFTPTGEVEEAYSQVGVGITDEITCDNPPRLLLELPLRPGRDWDATTTCTNLLKDSIRIAERVVVAGRNTVLVGATEVPVWELIFVDTQTDTPAAGGPTGRSLTTVTEDISARYGVIVRQVIEQGTDATTVRTDRLISLLPS